MIDYGKATAQGLTLEDPCNGVFDMGFKCGGGDFAAWYAALGTWVVFVKGLEAQALKLEPEAQWPVELQFFFPKRNAAYTLYDAGEPMFMWKGHLQAWGSAQQDLRDYAGALATWLEAKGVSVPPGSVPAKNPPPKPSEFSSTITKTITGLALVIGGYLAYKAFKE